MKFNNRLIHYNILKLTIFSNIKIKICKLIDYIKNFNNVTSTSQDLMHPWSSYTYPFKKKIALGVYYILLPIFVFDSRNRLHWFNVRLNLALEFWNKIQHTSDKRAFGVFLSSFNTYYYLYSHSRFVKNFHANFFLSFSSTL